MDYVLKIIPVSSGTTVSASTIKKGQVSVEEGSPHEIHLPASSAQIQGVLRYGALIKAGTDTSAVETAITAAGW